VQRLANYIGGELVPAPSGATLEVFEPATGQVYASAPDSAAADIERAVEAAARAFAPWSAMLAPDRARFLLQIANIIERDREKFARAESVDTGKPITLARSMDIPRAVANLRFFATAVMHTETAAHEIEGVALNYTLRRPRGVAGLISPWNLPLYLLTWKVAPALATGNTAVAKPSEVTPATAHLLAEACIEAGLPPGVLNIVHGTGQGAGAPLVRHPGVPTVSFTGSTGVGRWIGQTAGEQLKRVSLELGGKNPFLVFADAKMPEALDAAARAGFTNAGQVCLCGSRVLVERPRFDEFVTGLEARAKGLRIGDPLEESTQHGPQTSRAHLDKIASYVQMARDLKGTIHTGGGPVPASEIPARCRGGYYFRPTVISNLDPTCRVEQEEIFGPVVTVQPFDTESEAVALANGTPYGLAATLWTQDVSRAHRVAAALEAGIVWVNCWLVRDLRTPFGGMKQSGVGREGGWEAVRFFTEAKNVCVKL
jgi:aminomuconate-semialdehyde/2-hydroxymuconate-6-semialdehyde dehydrogenase